MTGPIEFRVYGLPAAQGSKRHVGNGVMVESSKAVKPWRQDVSAAAIEAKGEDYRPFTGPVTVTATYFFARPKSHYRTGRHADELRESAPAWVATKPDIEKVVRATHDALTTAGIWRDDAQVVNVHAIKAYGIPGAHIHIREAKQ